MLCNKRFTACNVYAGVTCWFHQLCCNATTIPLSPSYLTEFLQLIAVRDTFSSTHHSKDLFSLAVSICARELWWWALFFNNSALLDLDGLFFTAQTQFTYDSDRPCGDGCGVIGGHFYGAIRWCTRMRQRILRCLRRFCC